ncbi:uncharacterized protein LOC123302457 [Chrysoperla carnea]|uniref:uncharacterized protein LOC123302457 n=1 Tax=Chrysoperla carnea TaxID=189513 RepID=UPI001D09717E|nr:uncharacterized protein LOC123302457 [Chrysoperla carnea]
MKKHGRKHSKRNGVIEKHHRNPNNLAQKYLSEKEDTKKTNIKSTVDTTLPTKNDILLDSDDEGFGGWLRSSQGHALLRLFIIGNSIVIFLSVAWPQMQQAFEIIESFIKGGDVI